MIIVTCDQGTPEWFQARAGVITASMFNTIRKKVGGLDEKQKKFVDSILAGRDEPEAMADAGYKSAPKAKAVQLALAGEPVGDYSEASKTYAFRLAVERISGEPLDEGFQTWAMKRGQELEEDCRLRHEEDIGELVDLAGFVHTEDRKFGCSADSLIGELGGGEYKCFISPDKLRDIVIFDDWGEVTDQVQGCMWLTGRKWWDMCLYCPALKSVGKDFVRKRIDRDDEYIEAMEADLLAFEKMVSGWEQVLRDEEKSAA